MIRRDGAKPLELSLLKEALKDRRVWCGLGLVVKRQGDSSHFQINNDNGDVYVEVDLMPEGTPLTCRLGSFGGGPGTGVWRIPPEGTEVVVAVTQGEVSEQCAIIATLSTGAVPTALDGDTFVLFNPKKVHIESKDDKVEIVAKGDVTVDSQGTVNIQNGSKGIARKEDHSDVGTLTLIATYVGPGAFVFSGTYVDPDGSTSSVSSGSPIMLKAKLTEGSSKAKCG